jgi:hypothetical protein
MPHRSCPDSRIPPFQPPSCWSARDVGTMHMRTERSKQGRTGRPEDRVRTEYGRNAVELEKVLGRLVGLRSQELGSMPMAFNSEKTLIRGIYITDVTFWSRLRRSNRRTSLIQNPKTLKTHFEDVFSYNRSTAQSFAVQSFASGWQLPISKHAMMVSAD